MATSIFHRLTTGKDEIDNFVYVSMGKFGFIFTDIFIEQSPVFHVNVVQIAEFDLLPGRHKVYFCKIFENLFLKNHTGMKCAYMILTLAST